MGWEGVRVSEDGTRLRVVYITGTRRPADRVDVKWEPEQVTLTLSQMGDGGATTAMAVYHCVEVPVSNDISGRILVDGATGELATEKNSFHLDPELLSDTEQTLDSVFEPHELLEPREISA
jgi:hypothetical protein